MVGISEAVRAELRGSGIEVHNVMPTLVNTELTAGVGQKLIKAVDAEDVANEIVDALEVGRFDVYVPRSNAVMTRFSCPAAAPRRARRIGRLMKADKLMFEVDHGARRAYEERAAASEPTPTAAERGLEREAADAAEAQARAIGGSRPVESDDGTDLRRDLGPVLRGHVRPQSEGDRGGGPAGDAARRCWPGQGGG